MRNYKIHRKIAKLYHHDERISDKLFSHYDAVDMYGMVISYCVPSGNIRLNRCHDKQIHPNRLRCCRSLHLIFAGCTLSPHIDNDLSAGTTNDAVDISLFNCSVDITLMQYYRQRYTVVDIIGKCFQAVDITLGISLDGMPMPLSSRY